MGKSDLADVGIDIKTGVPGNDEEIQHLKYRPVEIMSA